jgi:hypothetical protein
MQEWNHNTFQSNNGHSLLPSAMLADILVYYTSVLIQNDVEICLLESVV